MKTAQLETVILTNAVAWRQLRTDMGNAVDTMAGTAAGSTLLVDILTAGRIQLARWQGDWQKVNEIVAQYNQSLEELDRRSAQTIPNSTHFLNQNAAAAAKVNTEITKWHELLAGTEIEEQIKAQGDLTRNTVQLSTSYLEGIDIQRTYRDGLRTIGDAAFESATEVQLLRSQVAGLASDMSALAGILSFLPGPFGAIGRGLSIGSSLLGLARRFIEGDTPGVGGPNDAGDVLSASPVQSFSINVGPARDPISLARDQDWLRALHESNMTLRAQGA